ncbi:hypothetical protein SAMN05192574_110152 [Mucilaginibacter gossypiicola]|uniref:Uncharacterized protein n=1 Tax=Mucilaginibacter gossypiicola TaxID=551995 RepID=A0A1H8RHG1_9SPHI|nr:hypothetical protein [Mucilaginibacter gossypiicola]SEO65697.1 hypothetical protein SAMN05192574_110152 [Mucilaginibacter gossypiicola]
MTNYDLTKLNLTIGDYIHIMNESGEMFYGNYLGNFDGMNGTFSFANHSNGQTQTIVINKLQRLGIS